ncbi:MAG: T9SS type A sorting domain-containing protein [Melioribacteraceae bacterium]|nr:T9SS type A sorting domain-containing protein [Melioribacteraceae bacterium]MCF8354161.1 T9SS type A sorting domain-containing protein [Melioribacteraceae bacterium]MCF8394699.1 T9SS type A sorting domain-containing protein [Melioribacteraceae bacterium]MCF8418084.1 T9SS type A sorting domain-containing protein [Melioribacteraceae bacterium]
MIRYIKSVLKQINIVIVTFLIMAMFFASNLYGQEKIFSDNINCVTIAQNKIIKSEEGGILIENKELDKDYYTLTIKANFEMPFVWIISDKGFQLTDYIESSFYSVSLPDGRYTILTINYNPSFVNRNMVFIKQIMVNCNEQIEIDITEASKLKKLKLLRADNEELILNQVTFEITFNLFDNFRFGLSHASLSTSEFDLYYNQIPPIFTFEWFIKGKQPQNNGDLYLINNEFVDTQDDQIIQNDPADLAHADFNYYFPDTLDHYRIQIAFFPFSHFILDDPPYEFPIQISIYQDTTSDINLYTSKFYHTIKLDKNIENFVSPKLRLTGSKVLGFNFATDIKNPIIVSENEDVLLATTPTYWFGEFRNIDDSLKIRGEWKTQNYHQLFLSQTNDVLRQFPIYIEVQKQESIIFTRNLYPNWGGYFLGLGFPIDSLTFPAQPDSYKVIVMNNHSELLGVEAFTKAVASFNTNLEDKNPPRFNSFQMLTDNVITNKFYSDRYNIVRIKLTDSSKISMYSLFYNSEDDTTWQEIEHIINDGYYYSTLPELNSGFYSLKTYAEDEYGNSITMTMQPAFYYENVTSIHDGDNEILSFKLYENYPNPFNPTTNIVYQIPKEGRVVIKLYDILGREIQTLVNKHQSQGRYEFTFDGSKLSSGVYIYRITAGEFSASKKFVLMK